MNFPNYCVTLKLKGFDISQLAKICRFIFSTFNSKNLSFSMVFLPIKKKHISVCRSPHVHKKSRTQFVYKRHKVVLSFQTLWLKEYLFLLFFFKTSILPGIEFELILSEKTRLV